MSEQYTPTTENVRDALSGWMWHSRTWRPGLIGADMNGAFDRWLDQVRREAKAEAVAEIRAALAGHARACADLHALALTTCGWKHAVADVERALDQLEQEGKSNE